MVPLAQQIAWYRELHSGTAAKWWDDKYTGIGPPTPDLGQATPANRPAVIDPDPAFNNFPTQNPDGINDVLIATAGTEAVFKPMHDGTGFLALGAFSGPGLGADEMLFATCSSSVQIGFRCFWDSLNTRIKIRVDNGVTSILSADSAAGSVPINTKNRFVLWVKDGLAPETEFEVYNNETIILAGTIVGTFSAANPNSRLVTFRRPSGGLEFNQGKWVELCLITDTSQITVYNAIRYLAARYP